MRAPTVPGARLVIDRHFSASYRLQNARYVFSRPTVSISKSQRSTGQRRNAF